MDKNEHNLMEIIEMEGLPGILKYKSEENHDDMAAKEQKFLSGVKFDMMLAKLYLAL